MTQRYKRLARTYSGKPVIVTGGEGSFGRSLIAELKSIGAIPISIDVADTPPRADYYPCNITDADALRSTLEQIRADYGDIRFIIANAAVDVTAEAHQLSPQDWRNIIETNLIGTTNLIALTYPYMQSVNAGDILIVSSGSAIISFPFGLPYTSSKGAQLALSLGLRSEAHRYGVNVSCVLLPTLQSSEGQITTVGVDAKDGIDRRRFLANLPGKPYSARQAAQITLAKLDRKQARIIFPASLALTSRIIGLFPSAGAAIRKDIAKRFDRYARSDENITP